MSKLGTIPSSSQTTSLQIVIASSSLESSLLLTEAALTQSQAECTNEVTYSSGESEAATARKGQRDKREMKQRHAVSCATLLGVALEMPTMLAQPWRRS